MRSESDAKKWEAKARSGGLLFGPHSTVSWSHTYEWGPNLYAALSRSYGRESERANFRSQEACFIFQIFHRCRDQIRVTGFKRRGFCSQSCLYDVKLSLSDTRQAVSGASSRGIATNATCSRCDPYVTLVRCNMHE